MLYHRHSKLAVFASLVLSFLFTCAVAQAQSLDIAVVKEDSPLRFSGKTVGSVKQNEIVKIREIRGAWAEIGKSATQQEWIRLDRLRSSDEALSEVRRRRATNRSSVELQQAEAALLARSVPAENARQVLERRMREEPANPFLRYEAARLEFSRQIDDFGMTEINAAIAMNSQIGEFYALRGRIHLSRQNQNAAIEDFTVAEAKGGADALVYNNLAWRFATHTDQKIRNGKQAIVFAEKACEMTGFADPSYIDTLAAAYAEDGQYNEAIKWQEKAMSHATQGDEDVGYEERLELYREGKPYRE